MSEDSPSLPEPKKASTLWAPLRFLTSLQLCVVILVLCALGIFLGTIAQVHEGLYLAQERWFKSWFILRQPDDDWWVWFYPGGYLLGVLLIINLAGAHLRRFKYPPGGLGVMLAHYLIVIGALYGVTALLSWGIGQRVTLIPFYFFMAITAVLVVDMVLCAPANTSGPLTATGRKIGVDLVHVGILVLLIGQLATDMSAKETHMSFREGQTMRYSEDRFDTELVISQDIPGDPMNDKVASIPQALIVKDEQRIDKEVNVTGMPVTVRLKSWEPNSELVDLREAARHEATLRQALATLESRYAQAETLADGAREAMESAGRTEIWKSALTKSGVAPGPNLVDDVEKVLKDPAKAAELLKNLKESFRGVMIGQFRDGQNPNMRYAANLVLRDPEAKEPPPEPQASSPVAESYRLIPLKVARNMESRNVPSGIVEVSGPSGNLGTWLVSPFLKEQIIDCGQTT
ncbi:MAG TPA: hypothetical protein VHM91_14225, partial [Verrucomicrobiales bacterium]|nr:hypothetical protein [Verrucomicrobiales bacterium]